MYRGCIVPKHLALDKHTYTGQPKNSVHHYEVTKGELLTMFDDIHGIPIRTMHDHVTVGKVVKPIWSDNGDLCIEFELDKTPAASLPRELVERKLMKGLSLSHEYGNTASGTPFVRPVEVSLCFKGARKGTGLLETKTMAEASAGAAAAAAISTPNTNIPAQATPAQATPAQAPQQQQQQQQQQAQQQQQKQAPDFSSLGMGDLLKLAASGKAGQLNRSWTEAFMDKAETLMKSGNDAQRQMKHLQQEVGKYKQQLNNVTGQQQRVFADFIENYLNNSVKDAKEREATMGRVQKEFGSGHIPIGGESMTLLAQASTAAMAQVRAHYEARVEAEEKNPMSDPVFAERFERFNNAVSAPSAVGFQQVTGRVEASSSKKRKVEQQQQAPPPQKAQAFVPSFGKFLNASMLNTDPGVAFQSEIDYTRRTASQYDY